VIEIVGLVAVGAAAGLLGSAVGVGGGVILVPALVVLFSFDQHLAQGTSLAVILPTAIVSTIGHARAHRVKWQVAIPLAISGFLAALAGARVAVILDGEDLRRAFAVLLLVVVVRMTARTVGLYRERGQRPE
jgi:uncharacterized protein